MRVTPQRRVKEISHEANNPRIFQGKLAEDYDGIGQYITVVMSEGSVSVMYPARIASGDFGTGQVIPVGTQVSVFVYRGRAEILSMGVK